tara:strand:+ start:27754 stop:29880 length:2127 start_codon:yes stop_codon:yes gene_type:complete
MPRYSGYGANDSKIVDEFDTGYFGFNNRFRPDQLKPGILSDSRNGRMDINGEWQVRRGIDNITSELVAGTTGIILSFDLNDSSPPTIDDDAQPRIWASCAYSNPNEQSSQYIITAQNSEAIASDLETSTASKVPYPPSYTLQKISNLTQAFNQVILFVKGKTALVWDGIIEAVEAGNFEVGKTYKISTPGTTDFTLIGAADSAAGTVFTATGVGTGDGTAVSGFTKVESGTYAQPDRLGDIGNNTTITDGVVSVLSTAHGLSVDDKIVVLDGDTTELVEGEEYYVSEVTDANNFKFIAQKNDTASAAEAHFSEPMSQGVGFIHMPAPDFGVYHGGRLVVPYEFNVEATDDTFTDRNIKDEIIFSNGLDINTYDDVPNTKRLTGGTADFIVGLHSFSDDQLLIFNRNSIHTITSTINIPQARTSLVTNEIGCVAKDSIVQVANNLFFLSDSGVYGASFQDLYNLRGNDVPLSESINKTIRSINRDLWQNSSAVYFDNKYYIAVPLNSVDSEGNAVTATKNNAILIYNFINKQWESIDTVTSFDFEKLIIAGDGDKRGVYCVNSFGGVHLLESRNDATDRISIDPTAANTITTQPIESSITTRDFTIGTTDRKKWNTFEMHVQSSPEEKSDFDISAETKNIDYLLNLGTLSSQLNNSPLDENEDVSIRGRIGNSRAYAIQLTINNFSGRPRIKSIKTSGGIAFNSTNTAI